MSILFSCTNFDESKEVDFGKPWLVLELEDTKLVVTEIAKDLDEPWEIAWGADNHIWVTEHKGIVKRLNPKTGAIKDVLSIPDIYYSNTPGLLGMVLHPDFNSDPFIYVHYNYVDSSSTDIDGRGRPRYIRSKIVRYGYDAENDTLISPVIILPDIPGNNSHNGSRLAITEDKKLLLATGDTGDRANVRNTDVLTGKVLRMNLDGSIPEDNPVAGSYSYSTGHRNQQGLVVANGKIYTSEHGQNDDDEINLITPGADYGWPFVEGFCDNETERNYCDTAAVAVTEPLLTWSPTVAVAGLDFYDNPAIPEWRNSLLVTSLKGRSLQVLRLDDSGERIVDQKYYLQKQFGRFRDLCVSSSGDVYLITSNTDWHIPRHEWMYDNIPTEGNDRIIKLSKVMNPENRYANLRTIKEDSAQIRVFVQERYDLDIPGAQSYIRNCAPCHLPSGLGVPEFVPPLVDNEWVSDKNILIETTLNGLSGRIEVNQEVYNDVMPSFAVSLSDQEITDILNYVLNILNDRQEDEVITVEEVANIRKKIRPVGS